MEKKKIVLKLAAHDGKTMQKAMTKVCSHLGVDAVSMEMKEEKLTVVGYIDIPKMVKNLRKVCPTDLVSVGSLVVAAEMKRKKDDEPKQMDAKEPKKPKEKVDFNVGSYVNPGYGGTLYCYDEKFQTCCVIV